MKYIRHLLILAVLATCTATLTAQPIDNKTLRNGPEVVKVFREIVAKPSEYTVRVLGDDKEVALGTIVDSDGWILTKWSEINHKTKIACKLKNGNVVEARIIGVKDDAEGPYDLALLRIDVKDLPTVEWRDSKEAKVGKWVACAGIGADPVAIGFVSVATRKFQLGDQPPKAVNASAGWLGVGLADGMNGAKVTTVAPKSPAEKASLKTNDVIYEAAGRKIVGSESLINTIQRLKPGDNVLLKVRRGDEELELKATLEKMPKQLLGNPQETMGAKLSTRRGGFPFILQHDSAIKPEDCGGPLVDLDGKTVGINISRAGRTETYALPSEIVQKLVGELKSGKLAPKLDTSKIDLTPANPNLILRAASSLNEKDKLAKTRPGRFMKTHEVQLTAGTTYVIELDSATFNAHLLIEDSAGKTLAEDRDTGGFSVNARIVFRAPADGTYRVVATSLQAKEVGTYTLIVRKQ